MLLRRRTTREDKLRWLRWCFLASGLALLAFVAYLALDSKIVQAYEIWRFEQAIKSSRPSRASDEPATHISQPQTVERVSIARGEVIGKLAITRLDVDVVVMEGVDAKTLRRAVGHIPGTAFPDSSGNVGVAGHRDTFFRELRNIRQHDEITLTTLTDAYRYQVESISVVGENESDVLKDSGGSTLTLVTCYPFYYVGPAPKRFIVRARRV
ncbi:MAG TPA: class D sortase [Clostridia bacterium]|nr:class D sortase [Clostridia bacterium]